MLPVRRQLRQRRAVRGLTLYGDVGRGKTHPSIALVREMIFRHGVAVRFMEFSRLLSLLKEGYSEGRSDAPVLTELAEVEVLAIDELGKGRLSDWAHDHRREVVSRRYNAIRLHAGDHELRPKGNPTGAAPPTSRPLRRQARRSETAWETRVYSRLLRLVDFVEVAGHATSAGPPYTDQPRLPFFLRPGRVILSRRSRTSSAFRRAHEGASDRALMLVLKA